MAAGYSVPFRLRGSGFLAAVSVRFFGRAPVYCLRVPMPWHGCPAIVDVGLPAALRGRVAMGTALPGFLFPAIRLSVMKSPGQRRPGLSYTLSGARNNRVCHPRRAYSGRTLRGVNKRAAEADRVHEVLEMCHSGYFYSGRLNRSGKADAGEPMNHCESCGLSTDSTLAPPRWPMSRYSDR